MECSHVVKSFRARISEIITHVNGGSEVQENKKHLENFTKPTKRKLKQNQNTRTLLRKFAKNSEESLGVVLGGGQLESPAKRQKCARDGESFNPI